MSALVYRRGPRQPYGQRRSHGFIGTRAHSLPVLSVRRGKWSRPAPRAYLHRRLFVGTKTISAVSGGVKGPTRKTVLVGAPAASMLLEPPYTTAPAGANDTEELVGAPRAVLIGAGQNSTEDL